MFSISKKDKKGSFEKIEQENLKIPSKLRNEKINFKNRDSIDLSAMENISSLESQFENKTSQNHLKSPKHDKLSTEKSNFIDSKNSSTFFKDGKKKEEKKTIKNIGKKNQQNEIDQQNAEEL